MKTSTDPHHSDDGNLESRIDPARMMTYTRDPSNRITEEALPGSLKNAYAYDDESNLISFTDACGSTRTPLLQRLQRSPNRCTSMEAPVLQSP